MRQNGLAWSVSSEKGTVRQTNQDSYFAAEQMVGAKKCAAFCVADGMGGTEHGELASRMAAVMLEGWFYKEFPDLLEEKADPSFMRRCLHELLKRINVEIITQYGQKGISTGTTVSFLLLTEFHYFFAHCGDSRIYILEDNEVLQITEDHTVRALTEKLGIPQVSMDSPRASALSSCIGVTENPEIQTGAGILTGETGFVLATDGVYRFLSVEDCILSPFNTGDAEELTRIALQNGGLDNATAILVQVMSYRKKLYAKWAAKQKW